MTTLQEGDPAPDFIGLDHKGRKRSLSKYRGKKLILFFYPQDNTPTCTIEVCNLKTNYRKLKKMGFELLGVSPDSARKHQNFIDKFKLPFPLLVDTERKVILDYKVWGPKVTFGKHYDGLYRTTFIINEEGIIEKVFTKVESKRHAEQILEAIM